MTLKLTESERALARDDARPGAALALRIVAEAARFLGAERLVPVASAHVDGCLYHGDSGVMFAERLVALAARTAVPTTCNVGALDLLHPGRVGGDEARRRMAKRLMDAHVRLGCRPSWTCAPYQAGHRPGLGEQVAWGESNAVAFVNSVLGARTERYGDFLDVSCAITGRAPYSGLHVTENRRARLVLDVGGLNPALVRLDAFFPVLGALLGLEAGSTVAAVTGLPADVTEDQLKALGAGAASTGGVGLFHVVGVTPEAPTLEAATQGHAPDRVITVDAALVRRARDRLSSAGATGGATPTIDCVALGSPHFSAAECRALARLAAGRRFRLPVYVCTGRHTLDALRADGLDAALEAQGVTFVADTCVVVAPILPAGGGVLMTNSAKFAFYARPNTGFEVVFGALADCVETAVSGRPTLDESLWR